jgi:hypothetical protein
LKTILVVAACLGGRLFANGGVHAADQPQTRSHELGELIAMLLPERGKKPSWQYPIGPVIAWETSIVAGPNDDRAKEMRRTGQIDVHVLGKRVTALARPAEVLPWGMTIRGPVKTRPTDVELKAGLKNGDCKSTVYSGCQFEIAPSLEKSAIRSRWVCELSDDYYSIKGYEIATPDGRVGYLMEVVSGGTTALTIMYSKTRLMRYCRPGIQRH